VAAAAPHADGGAGLFATRELGLSAGAIGFAYMSAGRVRVRGVSERLSNRHGRRTGDPARLLLTVCGWVVYG